MRGQKQILFLYIFFYIVQIRKTILNILVVSSQVKFFSSFRISFLMSAKHSIYLLLKIRRHLVYVAVSQIKPVIHRLGILGSKYFMTNFGFVGLYKWQGEGGGIPPFLCACWKTKSCPNRVRQLPLMLIRGNSLLQAA